MKKNKIFSIDLSLPTSIWYWTYTETERQVPINENACSDLKLWVSIMIGRKVYEHSPFYELIDTVETNIQLCKLFGCNLFIQGGILTIMINSEQLISLNENFFREIRAGNEMELNLKLTTRFSDFYTFRVTEDILIDETRELIQYIVCVEFFSFDKTQKIHFPNEAVLDEEFEGMFGTVKIKFPDGSIENAYFYVHNIHSYEKFLPKWYAAQRQEVVFVPKILLQSNLDEQSWLDYMFGIFNSLRGSSKEEIMIKVARFVQIEDLNKYLNTVLIDSDFVYTLNDGKVDSSDLKKWRPGKPKLS